MDLFWWLVAIVLMAVGLLGTVLPMVPGTVIILAAAILHRIMVGPEKGIGWVTLGGLVALTAISYGIDFCAGYFGAKRFGATRWGLFGALAGAVVGVFFGFIGIFIGPIVGAVAGEFLAGKRAVAAGRAAWGTLLGNLGGLLAKLAVALGMISWFLLAAAGPV